MARTRSYIRTRPTQNDSKTVIPRRKTNSPLKKKKNTTKPQLKKQVKVATATKRNPLKSCDKSEKTTRASTSGTSGALAVSDRASRSLNRKRPSSNEVPRSSRRTSSNGAPRSSRRTSSNVSPRSSRTPSTDSPPRQSASPPSRMSIPRSRSSSASSSISNSSASMESSSSTSVQSSRSPSPIPLPTSSNQPKTKPSQQSTPFNHQLSAYTEKCLEDVFQEMYAVYGLKLNTDDAVKNMSKISNMSARFLHKWILDRKQKAKDADPNELSKQNIEKLKEVWADLRRKWPNVPFLPTVDLIKLTKEINKHPYKIIKWFEKKRTDERKNFEIASYGPFQRILPCIVSNDLDKFQGHINWLRELHEKKFGEGTFKLTSELTICLAKRKETTKEEWEKWFEEVSEVNNYPKSIVKLPALKSVLFQSTNSASTSIPFQSTNSAAKIDAAPTSTENEEVIEITSRLSMDKEVSVYLEKAYKAQNVARAKRVEKISENIHEPKELIARWFIDRKYEEDLKNILDDHDENAEEGYENSQFFSSLPDHLKSFVAKFIQTESDPNQYEKEWVELSNITELKQVKQFIHDERKKRCDVQTSFTEERTKKITEEQMEILEEKYIPCRLKFLEDTIDLNISTAVIKSFHDKKTGRIQQADENELIFLGYFVKNRHAFDKKPKEEPIDVDEIEVLSHHRLPQNRQRAAPKILRQNTRGYPGIRYPRLAQNVVVYPEYEQRLYDPYDQRTFRDAVYYQKPHPSRQHNLAHYEMGSNLPTVPRQNYAPVDRLPVRNTNQLLSVPRTIYTRPTAPYGAPVAHRAGERTNRPTGPITATGVILPGQSINRPVNRLHPSNQGLQRPMAVRFVRRPEVSTNRQFHGPAARNQIPSRPIGPVATVRRVLLPNGATNDYNKWNVDQVVQWASLFLTDQSQIQLLKTNDMDGAALIWLVENSLMDNVEGMTIETFEALERNYYLVKDDFNRTNRS